MKIEALQREFRYNGVRLAEPNAAFTLPQVRDFYATVYPEIVSADIEGPEQIGAKAVYTFRRAVGTKGNADAAMAPLAQMPAGQLREFLPPVGAPGAKVDLSAMVRDLAELLYVNALRTADAEFIKDLQETIHLNQVSRLSAHDATRLSALHSHHCGAGLVPAC